MDLLERVTAGEFRDQPEQIRDDLRTLANDRFITDAERDARAAEVLGGWSLAAQHAAERQRHRDRPSANGTASTNGDGTNPLDRLRADTLTTTQVKNLPPPEWLVTDLLPKGAVTRLYGKSGVSKTFYTVDLALSLATGQPFHGLDVEPATTLYIVAEGVAGIGQRVVAWETHNDNPGYQHDVHWVRRAVNLHDPGAAGALADYATELAPGLIVFDTLNRCTVGADENSAKDAGVIIEQMQNIANQTGACVLTNHHPGKDTTKGGRGSSAFEAAMDTELEMTADGHTIVVTVRKQKDGPDGQVWRYRRVATGPSCILEDASDVGEQADQNAVEAFIALRDIYSDTPLTSSMWRDATGTSQSTIARHAKILLVKGMIRNVGTKFTPRYQPINENGGWPSD